jgi:hypothetical protein
MRICSLWRKLVEMAGHSCVGTRWPVATALAAAGNTGRNNRRSRRAAVCRSSHTTLVFRGKKTRGWEGALSGPGSLRPACVHRHGKDRINRPNLPTVRARAPIIGRTPAFIMRLPPHKCKNFLGVLDRRGRFSGRGIDEKRPKRRSGRLGRTRNAKARRRGGGIARLRRANTSGSGSVRDANRCCRAGRAVLPGGFQGEYRLEVGVSLAKWTGNPGPAWAGSVVSVGRW